MSRSNYEISLSSCGVLSQLYYFYLYNKLRGQITATRCAFEQKNVEKNAFLARKLRGWQWRLKRSPENWRKLASLELGMALSLQ